jgi:hypothetical protein
MRVLHAIEHQQQGFMVKRFQEWLDVRLFQRGSCGAESCNDALMPGTRQQYIEFTSWQSGYGDAAGNGALKQFTEAPVSTPLGNEQFVH